jgi:hypothetical protein
LGGEGRSHNGRSDSSKILVVPFSRATHCQAAKEIHTSAAATAAYSISFLKLYFSDQLIASLVISTSIELLSGVKEIAYEIS